MIYVLQSLTTGAILFATDKKYEMYWFIGTNKLDCRTLRLTFFAKHKGPFEVEGLDILTYKDKRIK